MRLAVDCRELVPRRLTGIGRFLLELLRALQEQRRGIEPVALVGGASEIPGDLRLRTWVLPQAPVAWCDQVAIPAALRDLQADVFFSPYYKMPLHAPCPCAVTIHDLIPLTFPAYRRGSGRLRAVAFRVWAGVLARRAAAVATDSEHSRAEIAAVLDFPAARIHPIPLAAPREFRVGVPPQAVSRALERYRLPRPYLLTVTNFLPHKNLLRLVSAYEALPAGLRQGTALVLAGAPRGRGSARPVSPKELARPGVHLPGFIEPPDLPVLYAGATALVFPSLAEGFGLPVLEAMACGTPVVCARAGALPEVGGEAVLYVDPSSVASITGGLEQVLTDARLRQTLAASGLERAKLFDATRTTARFLDLLESLAGCGGRRGEP